MLADGSIIRANRFDNTVQRDRLMLCDEKQNFDAIVIRHSLQMPLHLLRGFLLLHLFIIPHILTNWSLSVCDVIRRRGCESRYPHGLLKIRP